MFLYTNIHAQSKHPQLSPYTKSFMVDVNNTTNHNQYPQGYLYKTRNDGKVCISAIIKVDNKSLAQAALTSINAKVGTKAGSIWTVVVPVENVKLFVNIESIAYIQMDAPIIRPDLDIARKTTRTDSVHAGYVLPQGYSGKGVILGVMDFGFDYNHPTFYDTLGTKYRISRVWEMETKGGPAPAGYSYGKEITDTNLIKAQITDNSEQIHGSGVAGLSSGSGFGSPTPGKFKGIAYESEMVFVGVRRDSIGGQWLTGGFSDFIDGVAYMINYAQSVGKPIVVNISWGSHSGPHDGTSLVNQAFDTLSGPGKIIVMSAGNDGDANIHLEKTFAATDTAINTFLQFTTTPIKRTWIDIWGDSSKTFCTEVSLYSGGVVKGQTTGRICIDNTTHNGYLISANGVDTCFVQTITSASEYNHKPRVTLNIYQKGTDSVCVSVYGNDGKINMWNEYYYYGYQYRYACYFTNYKQPWATTGNTNITVSDMGAAHSTILVGAYNSKMNFTDINGIPRSYGSSSLAGTYCGFTSRGPYVDGRVSPDISAPGSTIATACNSADTNYSETGASKSNVVSKYTDPITGKNYYYVEFRGTSASSPVAAGIIALLLQISHTLTPNEVRSLLAETAIKDFYTGAIIAPGSNIWGQGKINAYGAVRKILQRLSICTYKGVEKMDCVLFPNPNKGSFQIDYNAIEASSCQVSVVDLTGKLVHHQKWETNVGANLLPLNLEHLPKGNYLLNIRNANSSITIQLSLQ